MFIYGQKYNLCDILMTLWTSQFMLNYCLAPIITVRVSSNVSSEQCKLSDVLFYEISIFITIVIKSDTRKIAPWKIALEPIPTRKITRKIDQKLTPGKLPPKYFPPEDCPPEHYPLYNHPGKLPLKNCPLKFNLSL